MSICDQISSRGMRYGTIWFALCMFLNCMLDFVPDAGLGQAPPYGLKKAIIVAGTVGYFLIWLCVARFTARRTSTDESRNR